MRQGDDSMKCSLYGVFAIGLALFGCAPPTDADHSASAAYEGPVIDMHLHALGAADQGPPPIAVCPGEMAGAAHDPAKPWGAAFMERAKAPACDDPIWSAETDADLRDQTLAELERLNVIGVLSGSRERVAEWKALAPEHIIAGHELSLLRDSPSAQDIGDYFDAGGFEVLAEVSNQYAGVAPNDEQLDDYWRIAAEKDIPVGVPYRSRTAGRALFISQLSRAAPQSAGARGNSGAPPDIAGLRDACGLAHAR